MTTEQQQELEDLLANLLSFDGNAEVQILISEIQNALSCNMTLREYRKHKKQQKKKQFSR
jgi:hypothetical protein